MSPVVEFKTYQPAQPINEAQRMQIERSRARVENSGVGLESLKLVAWEAQGEPPKTSPNMALMNNVARRHNSRLPKLEG